MEQEKLIQRINELAKIAKQRELSQKELIERQQLRKLYLDNFREGFAKRLDNIKVIDEDGNDVKLKKKKV